MIAPEIPLFDATAAYHADREAIDRAVASVLASGIVILGPEVEAFEAEFADYVGARHAVGVASGTDALALALRALGVVAGDEVITVANAGVPVAAAIRAAGAVPRFVDVLPDSLLMDPAAAAAAIGPRTQCLLPVHLYGQVLPIAALAALAERAGIALVEDCAQAHGARRGGRHVGGAGAIGCFSFYPTKNLGAFGDAGACVTNDATLAERLRQLRAYGVDASGHAVRDGLNSRLDEIQAAILRVRLRRLDASVAARRRLAGLYDAGLRSTEIQPLRRTVGEDAFHLYVVRCRERARVVEALAAAAIGSKAHYPLPLTQMPAFADWAVPLPNTERACAEVLSLPLFPGLAEDDVQRVCHVLGAR